MKQWAALLHDGSVISFEKATKSPYSFRDQIRVFICVAPNGAQFLVAPSRDRGESFDFKWTVDVNMDGGRYRYWSPQIKDPSGPVRMFIWEGGTICVMSTGSDEEIAHEITALEDAWRSRSPA